MGNMVKICTRCKEERDEKDFYLSHGYVQKICKFCSLKKSREWRDEYPVHIFWLEEGVVLVGGAGMMHIEVYSQKSFL